MSKVRRDGKMLNRIPSPVRFSSLSSQHYLPSLLDISGQRRVMHNCTISLLLSLRVPVTEVVSLRQGLFALLTRPLCFDWTGCEYSRLICFCQVGLLLVHPFWGDSVAAGCVRHQGAVCSFRLSVTLPAAADYNPYLNQQTLCCLFLWLWPRVVAGCSGLSLSCVPIAGSFSPLCEAEAHIAEQTTWLFAI